MDLLLRLVGLLGSLFTMAITVLMVLRYRKERRISALSSFISLVMSAVLLPAFILLGGARLNLLLGLGILLLGLVVGFLRGMTTKLRYQGDQVVGKNSILFLLGWGGSLALSQLLNLFGSAALASIGLAPVFLSTGTQMGMHTNILIRRLLIKPPA